MMLLDRSGQGGFDARMPFMFLIMKMFFYTLFVVMIISGCKLEPRPRDEVVLYVLDVPNDSIAGALGAFIYESKNFRNRLAKDGGVTLETSKASGGAHVIVLKFEKDSTTAEDIKVIVDLVSRWCMLNDYAEFEVQRVIWNPNID